MIDCFRTAAVLARRSLLAGAASVALALLAPAPQALADENTLTIGIEADLARLDPHISTTWNTFKALLHIYEGFVAEDLLVTGVSTPPIVPSLAESWEISDDKTTYTFTLRQGVTFHDGEPWNAEAAKFNLDRMTNPDFEFHQPGAVGMLQWVWGDLESYEVVDEYTFRITLKQPNSEFLRRLAAGGSGTPRMISPAAVRTFGNDGINANPVGTGPFRFGEREVGVQTVLVRNDDYWDPARAPKLERLVLRGIPEVTTRELGLLTGELDMISTPSPDSLEYLEAQGMTLVRGPVSTIYPIWLNFREEPLQDVRVRRAMAMAIDREGMAKFLRRGTARPAYGILNFGGPGWDPDYRDFPYDPEAAKQLLAEAGYPDGFETRLDWTMGGGGDVNTRADAEWIQRDLGRIGIRASIEVFDNGTYWDMLAQGIREDTCCMQVSWGETSFFWLDLILPESALPPNGFNSGWYENPKMGELLAAARAAPTEEEMVALLHQIRDIVAEEVAFIPVYTPIQVYAMRPEVKGFVLAPQHWADYTSVFKE
ncbi:MAG: ABC transporter substrate-binding protein [Pseudomonadota bacterium]